MKVRFSARICGVFEWRSTTTNSVNHMMTLKETSCYRKTSEDETMLRKMLQHSNILCVAITGLLWLATIIYRFVLVNQHIPPSDWVMWIVCNNLMIAGLSYQLGVISFRREGKKRR